MGNIDKFNEMANRYDTPERIEMTKIIADAIRPYIENGKDKEAMDYGCGTGLVGMHLLNDFQSMLFVDASNNMIEQVKQKISQSGIKNAEAVCCDLEKQEQTELRADYIFVVNTLIHIKEIEPVLSNLCDTLRTGGHLLIVDFDKNESITSGEEHSGFKQHEVHNGFEQEQLINTIKKSGFTTAKAKTFYHGKKIFMNKDASLFILDAVK